MLVISATLKADSLCNLLDTKQQKKKLYMCLQSNLPLNQTMCKTTLWTTTDFINRGFFTEHGYFWLNIGFQFTDISSVCKWVRMCICKELWRVKDRPEEFLKPLDASSKSASRKSSGRAEARCDSSWIVPLPQFPQTFGPILLNSLSAAWPNSEAEGSIL